MTSKGEHSEVPIELEPTIESSLPLHEILIRICKLFDDEREKFKFYYHFRDFCEKLLGHFKALKEENKHKDPQVDAQNEETIHQVLKATLKLKNLEYKVKLLKVLMVYWNKQKTSDNENYEKVKHEIISLLPTYSSDSIFNMTEDYITSECDRSYFELSFLLKQNQLKKFEFEFEALIVNYKDFYGDYWKYSMKKDCGRYLKEIAENREYYKTIEFMLHKCPFIELDSTIVTEFEDIRDLMFVFGDAITDEDKSFMDGWTRVIQNFERPENFSEENSFRKIFEQKFPKENAVTRKRLFGRATEEDTSLLEKMLLCPSSSFIFECVWNSFQLWKKPEIFSYKNPSGKALIDYVLESESDDQLCFFLMPQSKTDEDEGSFDKQKHFMVMKNNQIYSRTYKCIVEKLLINFMETTDQDDDHGVLFPHFMYLLEEMGAQQNLKQDAMVEKLISWSKGENFYEEITGQFLEDKSEMAMKLFYIEDILGNMIVYWSGQRENYSAYKMELQEVSPFYQLMFLLIEKDPKFCEDFKENMTKLEESFDTRYNEPEQSEAHSSNMLFIMLLAAIKTKQRNVIDFIFQNDTFQNIDFAFPENIVPQEIHYYTALKFLKFKHGIGQSKIPQDWLTLEVLEHFFDSQIKFSNQELIEVDYTSLLHPESQKKFCDKKVTDKNEKIMLDDVDSLNYILNQENLKELITHPVIETYINLKSLKYQRIFTWNFWAFVIFFITPFIMLIIYNALRHKIEIEHGTRICWNSKNSTFEYTLEPENFNFCFTNFVIKSFLGIMKYSHIIAIIFLFARETFQFILSDSWTKYFKKSSNLFEITFFIFSILLSIATILDEKEYIRHLEVIFILFTTISATSILPFAHVPNNMQILRKVAVTFLRIFYTFAIIFIAFSFAFCIMFMRDKADRCTENCDPTDNFVYPHTALVKIVTMLSGEYEIQPVELELTQLLFFSVFIITSFILFNLILGLSIEDVQELKKGSRAFDLMTKSERFIEVSKKVEDHYENNKDKINNKEATFWIRVSFKIIKFFLSKYMHLQSITQVMINIKTKEVFVKDGLQPILKISEKSSKSSKYTIDEETFKDIQDIITLKNKKTFKHLKKKLEDKQNKLDE